MPRCPHCGKQFDEDELLDDDEFDDDELGTDTEEDDEHAATGFLHRNDGESARAEPAERLAV